MINFGPDQFNGIILAPSAEDLSEDTLWNYQLIEKPTIPKKLDGKIPLIPAVPMVRPSPPQAQMPRRPPP